MADSDSERLIRRAIIGILLGGLLILSYSVLQLFLVPVAWAAIIAYCSWPLYQRLRRSCGQRNTISALIMTILLATAFVLPTLWMMALLRGEITLALAGIIGRISAGPPELPAFVRELPWLVDWLDDIIGQASGDPAAFRAQATEWARQGMERFIALLGDVGRNAVKLAFALITVFFFYRDGEKLLAQTHLVLHRFLGARVNNYLHSIGSMTKAVVWGLVATAFAQGVVAGLGYWWAGVPAPVMLAAITALIALIPFGTPFAWGSIALWLLANGQTMEGIGLLLWGTLVVSWVDNLIRPIVISNATRIPFLLVMFGVLGGLAAFGLIGLFVGPVILSVLIAVWREWLEESNLLEGKRRMEANPGAIANPGSIANTGNDP